MNAPDRIELQSVQKCLFLLDSGNLLNAREAIQETDLLRDAVASAIMLEARRLFPSPQPNDKAEVSLETLIEQKIRQQPSRTLDAAAVAQQLAAEFIVDGMSEERFALIRRLLASTQTRTDGALVVGEKVQLLRLAEQLERAAKEPAAEEELRKGLYDDAGEPRPALVSLFNSLPFLRPIVQANVDVNKLHAASLNRHARRTRWRWALLLIVAGLGSGLGTLGALALQKAPPREAASVFQRVGIQTYPVQVTVKGNVIEAHDLQPKLPIGAVVLDAWWTPRRGLNYFVHLNELHLYRKDDNTNYFAGGLPISDGGFSVTVYVAYSIVETH
ncbi:MAG: hypothetical protein K2X38_16525 [Gemmataceae bacterium]|nr:hypothetical protein [Gemmataceae bacterium]